MNFHDRLLQLRKEHGLSQEELGHRLGVTRQTVSKWEMGQTTPEMDKLIEMSALFGISIDALVGNATQEPQYIPPRFVGDRRNFNYEYKSARTLFGLPLVHINIGHGFRKATGIIAFGNIARGIISFGGLSIGVLSFGGLSLGAISFGGMALGLAALGGIAAGLLAVGAIALGVVAIGGFAAGMYALGGAAIASNIAVGGYAGGHIAVGDIARGDFAWSDYNNLTAADFAQIRDTIVREYPNLPKWVATLFAPH